MARTKNIHGMPRLDDIQRKFRNLEVYSEGSNSEVLFDFLDNPDSPIVQEVGLNLLKKMAMGFSLKGRRLSLGFYQKDEDFRDAFSILEKVYKGQHYEGLEEIQDDSILKEYERESKKVIADFNKVLDDFKPIWKAYEEGPEDAEEPEYPDEYMRSEEEQVESILGDEDEYLEKHRKFSSENWLEFPEIVAAAVLKYWANHFDRQVVAKEQAGLFGSLPQVEDKRATAKAATKEKVRKLLGEICKKNQLYKGSKVGKSDWIVFSIGDKSITIGMTTTERTSPKFAGKKYRFTWDGIGFLRQGQYLANNEKGTIEKEVFKKAGMVEEVKIQKKIEASGVKLPAGSKKLDPKEQERLLYQEEVKDLNKKINKLFFDIEDGKKEYKANKKYSFALALKDMYEAKEKELKDKIRIRNSKNEKLVKLGGVAEISTKEQSAFTKNSTPQKKELTSEEEKVKEQLTGKDALTSEQKKEYLGKVEIIEKETDNGVSFNPSAIRNLIIERHSKKKRNNEGFFANHNIPEGRAKILLLGLQFKWFMTRQPSEILISAEDRIRRSRWLGAIKTDDLRSELVLSGVPLNKIHAFSWSFIKDNITKAKKLLDTINQEVVPYLINQDLLAKKQDIIEEILNEFLYDTEGSSKGERADTTREEDLLISEYFSQMPIKGDKGKVDKDVEEVV